MGLNDKLSKIGKQYSTLVWVNSFFLLRYVYVVVKNTRSVNFSQTTSGPQRRAVKPIGFLIYVANIPNTPAEIPNLQMTSRRIYGSGTNQSIQSKLQSSLDKSIKSCEKLKFKLIKFFRRKDKLFKN